MTEREKMLAGMIYDPADKEIMTPQLACVEKLCAFNATLPSPMEKRNALLKEMLAECGENCYVEPPFHANWGGAPASALGRFGEPASCERRLRWHETPAALARHRALPVRLRRRSRDLLPVG